MSNGAKVSESQQALWGLYSGLALWIRPFPEDEGEVIHSLQKKLTEAKAVLLKCHDREADVLNGIRAVMETIRPFVSSWRKKWLAGDLKIESKRKEFNRELKQLTKALTERTNDLQKIGDFGDILNNDKIREFLLAGNYDDETENNEVAG